MRSIEYRTPAYDADNRILHYHSQDELPETDRYYIEINGANSVADVYLNGTKIGSHEGGYSGWRADMTQQLKETNELRIFVDNSIRKDVYPQTADFTFYGGLYRDVNIICVTETHFALEPFGTPGIHVTAEVEGCDANVLIDVETEGMASGDRIMYRVLDGSGHVVAESEEKKARIPDVRLWDGKKDPYLYTAEASIIRDGEEMDRVSARFGCRSFSIDPEKGFISMAGPTPFTAYVGTRTGTGSETLLGRSTTKGIWN